MHPVIAKKLVAERHDELMRGTASTRYGPRRGSSLVIIISAHRSA